MTASYPDRLAAPDALWIDVGSDRAGRRLQRGEAAVSAR